MTNPEALKEFGKYLQGKHDLENIEKDGGRIVTVYEIQSFLRGEWPQIQMPNVPELSTKQGESVKYIFGELDKLRGYRPPKRKAEAASILRMLKQFTPEQIINTYQKLKSDKWWQDKELYMMSVESQIGAIQSTPQGKDKFEHQKYGHLFQR